MWLSRGFEAHGLTARVTHDPRAPADVHVVSGPHFAKQYWLEHERTIWLDRAYYRFEPQGRYMASMPNVSLGWLRPDGGRKFLLGTGRAPPEIDDQAGDSGTIFLADYGGTVEQADTVRLHPEIEKPTESLYAALTRHRFARGYLSTALVRAALLGLEVTALDATHILNEPNWRDLLPFADWHWSDIESGEAWGHLSNGL